MKTNPEALKKLYAAMGGNEEDVENLTVTPDVIEAIADIYEGGGGGASAEVITLSAEDETAVHTALGQFVAAALQASGAPTITTADVSLEVFDDVMIALGDGSIVSLAMTGGTFIVTQYASNGFAIKFAALHQNVSEGVYANIDTSITVTASKMRYYGYATLDTNA